MEDCGLVQILKVRWLVRKEVKNEQQLQQPPLSQKFEN